MKNTPTDIERIETSGAQQLTLLTVPHPTAGELAPSSVHARFRLSTTTRKRGLAHIADIRRQLAESQARRDAEQASTLPPRRPQAA